MKKVNKQNCMLLILSIIAIAILFLIIQVQPINARPDAKYDDDLMINLANNIIDGKWLGKYNNITLVKGVFTPIWIAMLYILKIPFLTGQTILYILAIITFTIVIHKTIKNKYVLFLLFIYLLFNPVMYSAELCRVYRDGIYTSLILFTVSFVIAIFLNRKEKYQKLIKYFILLGISFTATYLCREETIWILPFIAIATIITIGFIILDKTCQSKIKKLMLYLIPIIIFLASIVTICSLNYKHYGVFMLNQYWSKEFKEVYGALTRIKSETEYDKVPITKDMLSKAYKISPTFAKLEKYFKLTEFRWSMCGDGVPFEIQGGWFHWALMNGVDSLGYYHKAEDANQFYQKVAEEINEACNQGKVEAYPHKRVSNTCRIEALKILQTVINMPKTIKYQYALEEIEFKIDKPFTIEGKTEEEFSEKFIKLTREKIATENYYQEKSNKIKLNMMEIICKSYKYINTVIFYTSIIMYIVLIIGFIKNRKKYDTEFLITSGILTLYLCRIFIVTFTSQYMWTSALNTMYIACIYPIQYIFSLITIYFGMKVAYNKLK